MFGPLMRYLENTNPQEFKLTEDIRNTFTNSEPWVLYSNRTERDQLKVTLFSLRLFAVSSNWV